MNTKIRVVITEYGQSDIQVINPELSREEKSKIRYAIYSKINKSYARLMNSLPPRDGENK